MNKDRDLDKLLKEYTSNSKKHAKKGTPEAVQERKKKQLKELTRKSGNDKYLMQLGDDDIYFGKMKGMQAYELDFYFTDKIVGTTLIRKRYVNQEDLDKLIELNKRREATRSLLELQAIRNDIKGILEL